MFLPALALLLAQTTTELERQQAAQQRQQAALTQQLVLENDRLARIQAQHQLDSLALQYRSATPAERAALQQRMQVQQAALSSIAQHERLSETELQIEVDRLRTNLDKARAAGLLSLPAIQRRQIEIQNREEELARVLAERQRVVAAHQPPEISTPVLPVVSAGVGDLAWNGIETRHILLQQELKPIAVTLDPSGRVILTFPDTLFEPGTATFTKAAHPTLDRIAVALKAQPALGVTIAVHTDARPAARNPRLADVRARAVRDDLVAAGVSREQISTEY